jgi:hypothetical protein
VSAETGAGVDVAKKWSESNHFFYMSPPAGPDRPETTLAQRGPDVPGAGVSGAARCAVRVCAARAGRAAKR